MDTAAPGALTVVVVPELDAAYPVPTPGALAAVARHLDGLRLLTTEVHVSTPQYVRLHDLQVVVRAKPGYTATALREGIADTLRHGFHALTGGPDETGYPFGASLHHADLVAAVFSVPGVGRVESLSVLGRWSVARRRRARAAMALRAPRAGAPDQLSRPRQPRRRAQPRAAAR